MVALSARPSDWWQTFPPIPRTLSRHSMRAVDLIRQKRDGGALDRAEIDVIVAGVTSGSWPDYQIIGAADGDLPPRDDAEETAALTDAMVRSGVRVTYPGIARHSRRQAQHRRRRRQDVARPRAARRRLWRRVPMMSGRGLGHTGGTLDKLEAIPGFPHGLSLDELRHGRTHSRLRDDRSDRRDRAGRSQALRAP